MFSLCSRLCPLHHVLQGVTLPRAQGASCLLDPMALGHVCLGAPVKAASRGPLASVPPFLLGTVQAPVSLKDIPGQIASKRGLRKVVLKCEIPKVADTGTEKAPWNMGFVLCTATCLWKGSCLHIGAVVFEWM